MALLLILAPVALLGGCAKAGGGSEAAASPLSFEKGELRVRQGTLQPRLLLTGALEADAGVEVRVPRLSGGSQQIRWLIADGTSVEAGDLLLELDTTAFTSELEDKRLRLAEKEGELERRTAELAASEADLSFRLAEARTELARQRIRAAVPEGLLSRREVEDRGLDLARAERGFEKAEAELASQQVATRSELAQLEIDRNELDGEIRVAEEAIESLRFVAPHAGVAVVEVHPWEGRKLQEGDTVWMGMTVLRLPDLDAMVVEAQLSDVDQGRLAAGDRVRLSLDAYPEDFLAGEVTEVSPIAREERGESLRRFFSVRIAPERVTPERMRPGMSVKIEAGAEHDPEAVKAARLLVPRAALAFPASTTGNASATGQAAVRTRAGDWVDVELGRCDSQACEVLSGLSEGQRLKPVRTSTGDASTGNGKGGR